MISRRLKQAGSPILNRQTFKECTPSLLNILIYFIDWQILWSKWLKCLTIQYWQPVLQPGIVNQQSNIPDSNIHEAVKLRQLHDREQTTAPRPGADHKFPESL